MHSLTLLTVQVLLAAAPWANATTAPATPPPPPATGTILLGDSMMRIGVGPALAEAFGGKAGQPVTIHARSATGLARPDVYDWPKAITGLMADKRFERAVVFLGSNDCQTLAGDGGGAVFGTKAWIEAYRGRMRTVLASLCDGATHVLWLGLPPMRSPKFNAHTATLNAVLESEVSASRCGQFVPTKSALADGKGAFAAYLKVKKRRLKVRDDDGIHITPSGGRLVAETVLAAAPAAGASPKGASPAP